MATQSHSPNTLDSSHRPPVDPAEAAEEAAVKALVDDRQWFLACDAARNSRYFETNLKIKQYGAKALLRLGAVEEAKKILEPLCGPPDLQSPQVTQLYAVARSAAAELASAPAGPPSTKAIEAFADLLGAVSRAKGAFGAARASDEETVGLLARAYKADWNESGDIEDARRCRNTYMQAFQASGGHWSGANAATMSWILSQLLAARGQEAGARAEKEQANRLASQVLTICERDLPRATGEERFWVLATMGEARLLQGEEQQAISYYTQAAEVARQEERKSKHGRSNEWLVSTVGQLRMLQAQHFPVPAAILEELKLPAVVVFAGHMLDHPDRPKPRFPAELEGLVRQKIDEALDRLDARIGFCSAACGSDLLFIEAMQDRDAEVNIVLPFHAEDFIQTSVAHAGSQWVRRFRRAIKLAGNSVRYATEERFLGTSELYSFNDRMVQSLAMLRAKSLGTEPLLLAVYDGVSKQNQGGTADIITRWPDRNRIEVIVLPSVAPGIKVTTGATTPGASWPVPPAPAAKAPLEAKRVLRTMLFADVKGFSKLEEDQVPFFMYQFLKEVSRRLEVLDPQPVMLNTWGDAIFAVMEEALPLVNYARELQSVVCATDWEKLGLPVEMSVRIGLHAGPVFEGLDPITRQPNVYGSHVNRAARIEPITLPGHIYASEQFVALLTSEQRARREPERGWPFASEYLGVLSLAKSFGTLPVYHVRDRRQSTAQDENTIAAGA